MPSRPPPQPPPRSTASSPTHNQQQQHRLFFLPPLLAATAFLSLLLLLFLIFFLLQRRLSRNRTAPTDSKSPYHHHHRTLRRFSYSLLRRSTASFSPSSLLGHGGFGSVYKASLPSNPLAVKLMVHTSSGSPAATAASHREFRNELALASVLNKSPRTVSILGYSTNRRGNKLLLVYELMQNRSLQDALLDRKCVELREWWRRFDITVDVARGLDYLHHCCDPPVIHGDIKPSNVLLDADFRAKIGDFGLAKLKSKEFAVQGDNVDGENGKRMLGEDNGSILEELASVTTGYDEVRSCIERSPESCVIKVLDSEATPETVGLSPEVEGSVSEDCFDRISVESGKGVNHLNTDGGQKKESYRRDCWWRQDNVGASNLGRVKDYVMEWIGSEIRKERPKISSVFSEARNCNSSSRKVALPKKHRKRWEWWASLDEDSVPKKDKKRRPKEWWREEFCDELFKKTKKKRGLSASNGGEMWWQNEDDSAQERKKRKSGSSRSSIDWWLDGLSGEVRNGRRNSQEWTCGGACSDIIPRSGVVSSTPSMRGTVCYIAPEYGGGGQLSEKCDVYSYGVLLLVLVSGRRPLQVTASPVTEFERANLISWARQLAQSGKLLDLVDSSINSLNKEQALLCITIALLCLQRSPEKRPTMAEIVGMLSGEAEPPNLPFEFSPSPPSNFQFKSRKKGFR